MAIPFIRQFEPHYARLHATAEAPTLVRRIVAQNPSAFTAWGTGTYVVGRGEVGVVDPGPADEAHIAALVAGLKDEVVTCIFITHTHLDHSPGTRLLKRTFPNAITYGFGPHSADTVDEDGAKLDEGGDMDFTPDVTLTDGMRVSGTGYTMEAIHTPGHTSNHLCYALPEAQAIFSGDHVMGWSTTVVSPPDGDMASYMHSLETLIGRASSGIDRVYFPTHGAAITDVPPFLAAYQAHRLEREAMIVARLQAGDTQIRAMVRAIYKDVDVKLHPAAARSVLAHMEWLVEKGVVRCVPNLPSSIESEYVLT